MIRTQCCDSNSKFKFTKSFSTLAAECGRRGRSSGVLSSLVRPLSSARSLLARRRGVITVKREPNFPQIGMESPSSLSIPPSLSLSLCRVIPANHRPLSLTLLARWLWGLGSDRVTILQNVQNERSVVRQVRNEKRTQRRLSFCLSFVMAGRRMGGLWGILTCVVFLQGDRSGR